MNKEVGIIYQINPKSTSFFSGKFIVAIDVSGDLCRGYLLLDELEEMTLCRFKGRAYTRVKWEDLCEVGKVEWERKDEFDE